MARIARVVVAGLPHHVAQRGNSREPVFFSAEDYQLAALIATAARHAGAEIWAYSVMPNRIHLIVTPADGNGLCGPLAKRTPGTPRRSTRGSAGSAISSRVISAQW